MSTYKGLCDFLLVFLLGPFPMEHAAMNISYFILSLETGNVLVLALLGNGRNQAEAGGHI